MDVLSVRCWVGLRSSLPRTRFLALWCISVCVTTLYMRHLVTDPLQWLVHGCNIVQVGMILPRVSSFCLPVVTAEPDLFYIISFPKSTLACFGTQFLS